MRGVAWRLGPLLGLLCVAAAAPTPAQERLEIEAPRFSVDQERGLYRYEDARVRMGGLRLFAGEVVVDTEARQAVARDFVRFRTATLQGTAERMELDTATLTGTLSEAFVYNTESGTYLEAEQAVLRPDGTLEAQRCSLTSCPPGDEGWRVHAESLHVEPDNYATAGSASLTLEGVPVLWSPLIAWPTVQDRRTGILPPRIGQDGASLERFDLGWRFGVPLFLNLGLEHDLTLTPETIEKRGNALEGEYRYAFREGQRGELRLWGIDESYTRDPADENNILPPGEAAERPRNIERYTVAYGHSERLGWAGRLLASYEHASDGQVLREYERNDDDRPFHTYEGAVSGQSALWGSASLSYGQRAQYTAESIYADTEAFTDLERRPQLQPRLLYNTGAALPGPVPLALDLSASTSRFRAPQALSGRLYTAEPSLSLPLGLGGGIELRPTVRRNLVQYEQLELGSTDEPDAPGQALPAEAYAQNEGLLELRGGLARVFSSGDPAEGRAIKHRITPRLIYRELEDVPQPHTGEVLPPRPALRLVTLRLDQDIIQRRPRRGDAPPVMGVQAELDLIQRYNLLWEDAERETEGPPLPNPAETQPGEAMLPLILDSSVSRGGYGIGLNLHYHHQLARITESRLRFLGRAGPHRSLGLTYNFNEFTYRTPDNVQVGAANNLVFSGETPVSPLISLGMRADLRLDDAPPPLERRLEAGNVFLDVHTNCYSVRVDYAETVSSVVDAEAGREYFVERRVLVTFQLYGLSGFEEPQQAFSVDL